MADGQLPPSGDPSSLDVIEGPRALPPIARRWVIAAVVAAIALVVASFLILAGRRGGHQPVPIASASTHASGTPTRSASLRALPAIAVARFSSSFIAAPAGWELFARGPSSVVRIQFAQGRVTTTAVPTILSDGPVSFVVAADRAIISPLDNVAAYVVRDGQPAQVQTLVRFQAGYAFPGPDLRHVWVQSMDGQGMTLVDLDGRSSGLRTAVSGFTAQADGAGYLAVADVDGYYDFGPDGRRRITTGTVLAQGPTGWLVSECSAGTGCALAVIDRATGARRRVGTTRVSPAGVGTISADGRTAAFRVANGADVSHVELLDLESGTSLLFDVPFSTNSPSGSDLVWVPGGRYVCSLDSDGHLEIIDRTGRVQVFPVQLPPLTALVPRPAA